MARLVPYVIGFAGYSDSGKTTLISKLTFSLKQKGYRVAVIKHDAHGHYKEVPGVDSTNFIESGADSVITVSPQAIHRYDKLAYIDIQVIVATLQDVEYILIEGFKSEIYHQIAVFRNAEQSRIVHKLSKQAIAIVTSMEYAHSVVPVFHLDDVAAIVSFLESKVWEL
ncbi:Molybdopterin-guanine dinucleotide biosynthesis adapter protein [compost metagenome]